VLAAAAATTTTTTTTTTIFCQSLGFWPFQPNFNYFFRVSN
jgi:hypothetical protein